MHLRYDAIAGAARVDRHRRTHGAEVPGFSGDRRKNRSEARGDNVIAGEARLTLDVRHSSDEIRTRAVEDLIRQAQEIAARRGLSVRDKTLLNQPAVAMDPFLVQEIEQAIVKTGCQPHRMVSGAGHDAMILAEKVPSAMIFLRTPGGISHDPAESVAGDDVEKAIACGLHLLDQLGFFPRISVHKRTNRA